MTDAEEEIRRSLKLLWGSEPARRRGRKSRVTSTEIIVAGIAMADREGLDGVSMRKVADEVGVTAMAIYSHVPSKAVLIDAMLDHVLAALTREQPPAGAWREQLAWTAHRAWTVYQAHPWALSVTMVRRPFGPNLLASLEVNLRIVSELRLRSDEMIGIINALDDYVHGALAWNLAASRSENESGISNPEWFQRHGQLVEQFADLDAYPILTSLWRAGQLTDHRSDFDFGLQRVLDGIEYGSPGRAIRQTTSICAQSRQAQPLRGRATCERGDILWLSCS